MSTKKSAFTLVEMLITLTIFAVVAAITVTLLVNGLRAARKIQAQVLLYSEVQALMDQMERDVERNTVDYEAYYAREVKNDTGWETPDYGQYAQSFYYPGTDGTENGPYPGLYAYGSTYYGAMCSDGSSYPDECSTPEYDQQDRDVGTHPFTGIDGYTSSPSYTDDPSYMNAFCESSDGSTDCTELSYGIQDQLILVNGAGDERTIYALESVDASTTEYYLSKVGLTGADTDNDGIVDTWTCSTHFDCTDTNDDGDSIPASSDLTDDEGSSEHDFVSLSPAALNIEEFHVIVNPFEDPYRAFAEEDVQYQPQVTIILRATLSSDYSNGLLGELPSILIQRTISTGVYAEVPSYE